MTKTAFITGATGFLGLNLVEELSKRQWNIIALYVPAADLKYLSRYNVTKVCGDINDYDNLVRLIPEACDVIFHLAANTSAWFKNNQQQYRDNVIGTQNMVNAALVKKVRRFVYTSSVTAYGYHSGYRIDETTPSNALTCGINYGSTKFMAEQIVKDAVRQGLQAVILNPCNIIGPYDINNWTKQFLLPVYNNNLPAIPPGKAMWCHVKDIVNAHIAAVDLGITGENYLLGGVEASFKDLVNEIEILLGKEPSKKVQTKLFLKMAMFLFILKSRIDGKEPILTPEKYKRAVGNITCDYRKAVKTLNYSTSPLGRMIRDSYDWLRIEKII